MTLHSTLLKAMAVGALGGLLFGFDTAVIAGATQQLTVVFSLTPATLGLTVSIALWGTVIGAGGRVGVLDPGQVVANNCRGSSI